jgi:hypothetical protein
MDSESRNESYLVFDIDDSLTRAILIERTDEGYKILGMGQAQTTVDPPNLDVTIGVQKAARDLGQKTGRDLWGADGPSKARLLCSSNTGGGLYMMVAGVIGIISAESAQRAALGAGALLIDVFSKSDPRPDFEMIEKMRSLKPDMFLLAGGTDGGAVEQVLDMTTLISAADVKPRFGSEFKLPLIFAGNIEAREKVSSALSKEKYGVRTVDNVRPVIERENLGPAKEAIYDSFREHVIIHSPGYDKLVKWSDQTIVPTQAAIGNILYAYALERQVNLLAVDVGGTTTDVYSVYQNAFNRSLNADVGLTYGISNIMKIAGIQNIMRWIPKEMDEREARNIVGNLMVLQPPSLTQDETLVQEAAAREAIRLAVENHRGIASRLKGVRITRTVADIFGQSLEPTYLNMLRTQVVIGRGKIFTQSQTGEATILLLDALQPEGVTEMMIDRLDIMPHLGMLLKANPEAAKQILTKKCLSRLGTCLAPKGRSREGEMAMMVRVTKTDGTVTENEVRFGELKTIAIGNGETAKVSVTPRRGLDIGEGRGKKLEANVIGGELGLILDARGRPLSVPVQKDVLVKWAKSVTHGHESSASNRVI